MTYAGRLDPMASGLLLVLLGEEVREKEKYLKLGKEYAFEVLFGFATDTYDILGYVTHAKIPKNIKLNKLKQEIKENLKFFKGKFRQNYPAFSSKTIRKVRMGNQVPTSSHTVEVKSLKFLKLRTISTKKLLKDIERRVAKVEGDFRQKEILKIWRNYLMHFKGSIFLASFYVKCTAGMYVRALANDLGKKIKIPALAYSIKRTKIGKWQRTG